LSPAGRWNIFPAALLRGEQTRAALTILIPDRSEFFCRYVCCTLRLCKNFDVELARRKFVSIALNKKRSDLPVTVGRRKERKQFCAFSARARFHTAWVKNGSDPASLASPFHPQEQTSSDHPGMSEKCH
jgi:hypothetical protein